MRPKIIKNIDESFFELDCDTGMKNPRSVFLGIRFAKK